MATSSYWPPIDELAGWHRWPWDVSLCLDWRHLGLGVWGMWSGPDKFDPYTASVYLRIHLIALRLTIVRRVRP